MTNLALFGRKITLEPSGAPHFTHWGRVVILIKPLHPPRTLCFHWC